ncbi:MAG TPA: NAD(P)H-hydrate dehydratase [Firmicutes bacterium]|nr:NAD(P)H-hydrate dehydratase [Bacillota bacterium]
MRVVTGTEMLAIDRYAIASGMPGAALMEMAGYRIACAARQWLSELSGRRVGILCGTGNNGGDGFVAARYLRRWDIPVRVFLVGDPARLSGEAAAFAQTWRQSGGDIVVVRQVAADLVETLNMMDLLIDALLGTGAQGEVRQPMAALISAVNKLGKPVLAVDAPSGIDCNTGLICGVAMQAQRTVTIGLPKLGLLLYPGAAYVGILAVASIGFTKDHLAWREATWPLRYQLTEDLVCSWSRKRLANSHKGAYGKVMVVAGSAGMMGAGALTVQAALRSGAGLAVWAGPERLWSVMAQKVTESMTLGLPDKAPGVLTLQAREPLQEQLATCTVLAIGPGLGRQPETMAFVSSTLAECGLPTVVDADALYVLAAESAAFSREIRRPWVLTPHPGEAARLLGCTAAAVEYDRVAALEKLVERWQCTVVLKGVPTLVSGPDMPLYINSTGNAGMATGGSGDVLTGVIAGLLAQGYSPEHAAAAGVYFHGVSGDLAAEKGSAGLIAGDLLTHIPTALSGWEQ